MPFSVSLVCRKPTNHTDDCDFYLTPPSKAELSMKKGKHFNTRIFHFIFHLFLIYTICQLRLQCKTISWKGKIKTMWKKKNSASVQHPLTPILKKKKINRVDWANRNWALSFESLTCRKRRRTFWGHGIFFNMMTGSSSTDNGIRFRFFKRKTIVLAVVLLIKSWNWSIIQLNGSYSSTSKRSLNAVLLSNGDDFSSVSVGHVIHMKETYPNFLDSIKYAEHG